ncbi:hypothetical protein LP316_14165 [Thalassotalea sp. LPB0316]|uniref:hypothetical protein n=1 Tax=Thalassotalea sp. LPB0316 TaxID=2769490 RepID=UPI001868D8C6|nr:hypothetical protein [Thalassotalea sp. LPB0316]QOL25424.1 hypothetical protein LP316_14165 [Thalassotalea sp. LPB0316]
MKKLFALVIVSIASTQAFALSSNVKMVALDDSPATNLCIVAAEQGYQAAKKVAVTQFSDANKELSHMTCNGKTLKRFASEVQKKALPEQPEVVKVKKFIPANNDDASNLCITALNQGIESIQDEKVLSDLYCNGVIVTKFAKTNAPQ